MGWEYKNEEAERLNLKSKRLVLNFSIQKHVSPASKILASKYPQLLEIRAESATAAADLLDPGAAASFASPSDANGVFGLLLHNENFIEVVDIVSCTCSTGTVTISSFGVTALGNAYINLTSNQNFNGDNSTVLNFVLAIDFKLKI